MFGALCREIHCGHGGQARGSLPKHHQASGARAYPGEAAATGAGAVAAEACCQPAHTQPSHKAGLAAGWTRSPVCARFTLYVACRHHSCSCIVQVHTTYTTIVAGIAAPNAVHTCMQPSYTSSSNGVAFTGDDGAALWNGLLVCAQGHVVLQCQHTRRKQAVSDATGRLIASSRVKAKCVVEAVVCSPHHPLRLLGVQRCSAQLIGAMGLSASTCLAGLM